MFSKRSALATSIIILMLMSCNLSTTAAPVPTATIVTVSSATAVAAPTEPAPAATFTSVPEATTNVTVNEIATATATGTPFATQFFPASGYKVVLTLAGSNKKLHDTIMTVTPGTGVKKLKIECEGNMPNLELDPFSGSTIDVMAGQPVSISVAVIDVHGAKGGGSCTLKLTSYDVNGKAYAPYEQVFNIAVK